jgi:hypothetical protein
MNSAGYRYAASDQAFYIPAIVRHLMPESFPRDAVLLDGQSRLMLIDNVLAWILRATGISMQWLFLVLYLLTIAVLFAAVSRLGRSLYRAEWTGFAFVAAMTLRHSISKTGANTLEGYFHPRMLAFALGLTGVGFFLERRDFAWLALVAIALSIHPTTGIWFAVWLGVAAWVGRPAWRRGLGAAAVVVIAAVVLILWRGPLAGHLERMDPEWLAAISDKDYLFPLSWPLTAWLANLASVAIVFACWRTRARAQLTAPGETAIAVGALALFVMFLCWLPFNEARIAVAVELQLSRVFWMIDVLATAYAVWWIVEGPSAERADRAGGAERAGGAGRARSAVVLAVLVVLSLARGTYSTFIEFRDRPLIAFDIKPGDWRDAMAWARTTDRSSGWLADPDHAAIYGSSVRAAAWRDVLIERLKDHAIAMYDREAALRVTDRERALGMLQWDTAGGARALARRYGLDYLIVDHPLDLPLAHRSGSLFIYRLR